MIRFVRVGRRNQAFFHLVVAEKARAVQKKIVEKLGYYNPHTNGGEGELVFDEEAVKKYLKNGAQMSQSVARKLSKVGFKEAGKFIEERPTKPKKEPKPEPKKEEKPAEEVTPAEEPATEAPVEETPVENAETEAPEEKAAAEPPPAEEPAEAEAPVTEEAKEKVPAEESAKEEAPAEEAEEKKSE